MDSKIGEAVLYVLTSPRFDKYVRTESNERYQFDEDLSNKQRLWEIKNKFLSYNCFSVVKEKPSGR